MMLTRKSLILLGVVALLTLLNFIPVGGELDQQLPALPEIARSQVTRIEITQGQVDKVILEGRFEEGFQVIAPFQAEADQMSVRPLLNLFTKGPVPMDLRVDEGNLETYGVDDQQGILVELFTGSELPALSMIVGYDVPGGSSFVRLSDSDIVYRAKVGTRARYERDPLSWKNKMLTLAAADSITDVDITVFDGQPLHFQRRPTGGRLGDGSDEMTPWVELNHLGFALDQEQVDDLASTMGTLRGGEVLSADYDGGFDPPAVEVRIATTEGKERTIQFGRRQAGRATYARVVGEDAVYVVALSNRDGLLRPIEAYQNMLMFAFSRTEVLSYTLQDELGRVVIESDADAMWHIVEPINTDTDVKKVIFSINTLATLRADGVAGLSPAEAGLVQPGQVLRVKLRSGEVRELEVGGSMRDQQGRLYYYVRRSGRDQIYLLRDQRLSHLRQAFGRSQ